MRVQGNRWELGTQNYEGVAGSAAGDSFTFVTPLIHMRDMTLSYL